MKLIDVKSAKRVNDKGWIDFQIIADIGEGEKEYPYTYSPDDPAFIATRLKLFLEANPDFPIQPQGD